MKSLLIRIVAAVSLLTLGSPPLLAKAPVYSAPDTALAQRAATLLHQGAQAISSYIAACTDHDWPRLERTMTSDAVVEYPLVDAGSYLSLDSVALEEYCGTLTQGLAVVNARIFPTSAPDSLFVEYQLAFGVSEATETHLVLLTLRGDRIARLRDFTVAGSEIIALWRTPHRSRSAASSRIAPTT